MCRNLLSSIVQCYVKFSWHLIMGWWFQCLAGNIFFYGIVSYCLFKDYGTHITIIVSMYGPHICTSCYYQSANVLPIEGFVSMNSLKSFLQLSFLNKCRRVGYPIDCCSVLCPIIFLKCWNFVKIIYSLGLGFDVKYYNGRR